MIPRDELTVESATEMIASLDEERHLWALFALAMDLTLLTRDFTRSTDEYSDHEARRASAGVNELMHGLLQQIQVVAGIGDRRYTPEQFCRSQFGIASYFGIERAYNWALLRALADFDRTHPE